MSVYRWYCAWENNASCWADHDSCGASSRHWYRDKKKAKDGARRHERQTGHRSVVQSIDGRHVRGDIR